MKVYLTSAFTYKWTSPPKWLEEKNQCSEVIVTPDPADADVILFVESHPGSDPYFRRIFNHDLYKKYKDKCVLYHDADFSITPMRTVSPSLATWQHNPKHNTGAHYIARIEENENLNSHIVDYSIERKYLYSFIGANNNEVRNKILTMPHPANTYIKDSSGKNAWELKDTEKDHYKNSYIEVSDKSCFILCPAGKGPSSYRLFETMQLGRVPVILSDTWVKIPGIAWDECSVIIAEKDILKMPQILEEKKDKAIEMGKVARQVWEEQFSPGQSLYQLTKSAMQLVKNRYSTLDAAQDYSLFLKKPLHIRHYLRYLKQKLQASMRKRK